MHRYVKAVVGLVLSPFLSAVLTISSLELRAQAPSRGEEYRVKAAFLFHFAQLVEWPADALGDSSSPVILCTLGEDPFRGALEAATAGKIIGSRAVRVRHAGAIQDTKGCQIVFIATTEKDPSSCLSKLKDEPVLTVGESEGFLDRGGMINLTVEDNKVRFGINLEASEHARLNISSRLLLLATRVIGIRKNGKV